MPLEVAIYGKSTQKSFGKAEKLFSIQVGCEAMLFLKVCKEAFWHLAYQ